MPLPKDPTKIDDYKRRIGFTVLMNKLCPPYEVEGYSDIILSSSESLSKEKVKCD